MNKEYKAPEMTIIEISVEDIIQTSGVPGLNDGGENGTISGNAGSGIW